MAISRAICHGKGAWVIRPARNASLIPKLPKAPQKRGVARWKTFYYMELQGIAELAEHSQVSARG